MKSSIINSNTQKHSKYVDTQNTVKSRLLNSNLKRPHNLFQLIRPNQEYVLKINTFDAENRIELLKFRFKYVRDSKKKSRVYVLSTYKFDFKILTMY